MSTSFIFFHYLGSESEVDFDDNAEQEEEQYEEEEREEERNEEEEEENQEELLKNTTARSQKDIQDQIYVNNGDDGDIATYQRRPLNDDQQIHNRSKQDKF